MEIISHVSQLISSLCTFGKFGEEIICDFSKLSDEFGEFGERLGIISNISKLSSSLRTFGKFGEKVGEVGDYLQPCFRNKRFIAFLMERISVSSNFLHQKCDEMLISKTRLEKISHLSSLSPNSPNSAQSFERSEIISNLFPNSPNLSQSLEKLQTISNLPPTCLQTQQR